MKFLRPIKIRGSDLAFVWLVEWADVRSSVDCADETRIPAEIGEGEMNDAVRDIR